jgi:hypothetical protein
MHFELFDHRAIPVGEQVSFGKFRGIKATAKYKIA